MEDVVHWDPGGDSRVELIEEEKLGEALCICDVCGSFGDVGLVGNWMAESILSGRPLCLPKNMIATKISFPVDVQVPEKL